MNYKIDIYGFNRNLLDECFNILLKEVTAANYHVTTYGRMSHGFAQPYALTLFLRGSSKDDVINVLLDFDNSSSSTDYGIAISPKALALPIESHQHHYWCALSALLQSLHDTSSAFLTGYLLDKGASSELEYIKGFNASFNVTMALQQNAVADSNKG